MPKSAIVIGAGFSSLSAACVLAANGLAVTVFEKNEQAGGRARLFEQDGFRFDMGPSWYWMPDVFENFFNLFGKSTLHYYRLKRLDPSYTVFFGKNNKIAVPAGSENVIALFESIEKGSGKHLKQFLAEAEYKYLVSMSDMVFKPSLSVNEFFDLRLFKAVFKMHLFKSFSGYVRRHFKNPQLIALLEFPVLFLGATPTDTPALYSMMNYADIGLGTWYPMGGMKKIADAMEELAISLGVKFKYNSPVQSFIINSSANVTGIVVSGSKYGGDVVVSGADYYHTEQLLPITHQSYSQDYWNNRTLAPSCLIYYLGINKRVNNLTHHNLFFDADFKKHAEEIYKTHQWPSKPLFYLCCPSKTDDSVAPRGMENIFILIPVPSGVEDTAEIRNKYFDIVLRRVETHTGESIAPHIIVNQSYAYKNFIADYNAFKGNAYGLANILKQTAFLKPSIKSKKINNLYYTGQLTVPGPGVPPAIISGQIVAKQILKDLKIKV